jgi:hypothetical protein
MTKKERMIKDHIRSMFNMRFMGLEWQKIHQKRWDENAGCDEDTCDCEAIYYKKKGTLFFDGTKST